MTVQGVVSGMRLTSKPRLRSLSLIHISFVSGKSDCKVTALTSGGSQANVEDLTNGNVQLAFVQSDVMNYACLLYTSRCV